MVGNLVVESQLNQCEGQDSIISREAESYGGRQTGRQAGSKEADRQGGRQGDRESGREAGRKGTLRRVFLWWV